MAGEETGEDSLLIEDPLGSSACLASLRSAAAKLAECADGTGKVLLAAGLPLGTMEPLREEGLRGLTVAVVRVAVEIIPSEGAFGSWLMLVVSWSELPACAVGRGGEWVGILSVLPCSLLSSQLSSRARGVRDAAGFLLELEG